jgi:DNA-binding winged helix-turn-helix (wHTH) protein
VAAPGSFRGIDPAKTDATVPRYHFGDFVLSPRRRLLLRGAEEQQLIPRYFDLLVFLVERRHEAVHRRDIFERVWSDAVVSDSALSQAIRTIRRVLGDDPRDPRFIRTVSRHGYRFVFPDVREEEEDAGSLELPTERITVPADPAIEQDRSLERAAPALADRWTAAAAGAGLAGTVGGTLGGLILASAPDSAAPLAVVPVLAVIGACCGAAGGAGVGAGLAAAEALDRSRRTVALVLGAAIGGGIVGTTAQWLARWSLAALVGVRLDVGGTLEGLCLGAAAGLGYGVATPETGPAARHAPRLRVAALTAASCGLAALLLTSAGRPLVGGTIHAIATGSGGSPAALTPVGRLIGETDFGPLSSAIIGTGEAVLFGLGLALGLRRR